MVMFAIATYSSCIMIHDSYVKWDESPGNAQFKLQIQSLKFLINWLIILK